MTVLSSVRLQMIANLAFGVVLPSLAFIGFLGATSEAARGVQYSITGASVAVVLSTIVLRLVTAFPGVRAFAYVLPAVTSGYGLVVAIMFAARLEYNRLFLSTSFVLTLGVSLLFSLLLARYGVRRFHVVPFGRAASLPRTAEAEWIVMAAPEVPAAPRATLVADLHYALPPDWEAMLAEAAVSGRPVYHVKQLQESLTGRVSMEHLSENTFGSLVPNLAYVHLKRLIDLVATVALLPLLIPVMLVVAVVVKATSPGPVFFLQTRMGYRGRPFRMVKFRTMRHRVSGEGEGRDAAMTRDDDDRVTAPGRFLRRSRLDELPQVLNILQGTMSWIGPRPEATTLSEWYKNEIPFFHYRHIVRPGITGWAQVNQGHVVGLGPVGDKLAFDFYYVKNFSLWLDIVIVLRTIQTILTGFGAR